MLVFSTGVIAAALVAGLASSWLGSKSARENFVRQGKQITENLAKQAPLALLYSSADNARDAVAATLAFPDVRHVAIYGPGNQLLLEQGVKSGSGIAPALKSGTQTQLESETQSEWVFIAPVYSDAPAGEMSPFETVRRQPELLGHVRVILSKNTLYAMMRSIFLSNILTSLALAVVLLFVLSVATRRVTRPLSNLANIMRRAEQGELRERAALSGPRDITDMAHAFNEMMSVLEAREAELRKNRDDALESARIKAQFTANVGHEIRTPMNGVLGMLDLLREMRLTRKQREYVEIARNSGHLLLTLLNDLLDFSKLEVGKLKLENIRFDLRQSIEDALELLAEAAHRKHLELAYFIAGDVPQYVVGDPTRLRQIITNLIGNAIKFTNEGDVSLYVSWVPSEDGDYGLRFEVVDTGIGIDATAQTSIFDSYAQADGWTTRRFGGTGLGLSITKQLVQMMDGEIGVLSALGKGSTFWFTLKLKAEPGTELSPPQFPGRHALVVERVECSRRFLGEALESAGMRVTLCPDLARAREALLLTRQHFDVLVINDSLGGAELIRAARSLPRYSTLCAVLMGKMQTAIHSADSEGIVWLSKPVRRQRLLESIAEATGVSERTERREVVPPATRLSAHVLVVEDNLTNQLVASGMLDRLGCRIDVARNGREGVEAVARTNYDVVLMDCNMPEMDGYEATTRIRGLNSSHKDTVVIAMTANVHPGEVEKCLSVGMNDYLSKPLGLEQLREKIVKWMTSPEHTETRLEQARASYPSMEDAPAVLDKARFGQLQSLFSKRVREFVDIYLKEVPEAIAKLKTACQSAEAKQIVDAAHSIKGTSMNLGLAQLAGVAREIEQLARENELGAVSAALRQLDNAFDAARQALQAEVERTSASAD